MTEQDGTLVERKLPKAPPPPEPTLWDMLRWGWRSPLPRRWLRNQTATPTGSER